MLNMQYFEVRLISTGKELLTTAKVPMLTWGMVPKRVYTRTGEKAAQCTGLKSNVNLILICF